jgi:large subunit ribosomal protein L29
MATASDLVFLETDELDERLDESRRELLNLRFQMATGQLDNSARIGQVRRDIARMLTVMRDREIAEAEGTYVEPSAEEQATARAHLAAEDEAVRAHAASTATTDEDADDDFDEADDELPLEDDEADADDEVFEDEDDDEDGTDEGDAEEEE